MPSAADQSAPNDPFERLTGCKNLPKLAQRHAEWRALVTEAEERYRRVDKVLDRVEQVVMLVVVIGCLATSHLLFPHFQVIALFFAFMFGTFVALGMEALCGSLSTMRFLLVFMITTGSLWWYFQQTGFPRNSPAVTLPFEALEIVMGTYVVTATGVIGFAFFAVMFDGIVRARIFRRVPLAGRAGTFGVDCTGCSQQ